MKKFSTILTLLVAILLVGCLDTSISENEMVVIDNEKITVEENGLEEDSEYFYFWDMEKVSEDDFSRLRTSGRVVTLVGAADGTTTSHGFSSNELMIAFSDDNNFKLDKLLEFEATAALIEKEYDAINFYNENGTVPEKYTNAINEAYNRAFGQVNGEKVITVLKDLCAAGDADGQSQIFSLDGPRPFMPPTWNNRVSAHEHLALYGVIAIYNNAFFFDYIETIVAIGYSVRCWSGNASNNMSSEVAYTVI